MSILIAIRGWDAELWRARVRALMPGRPVLRVGEPYDPGAIRYALSWRHAPGALKGLPNLKAIFSLGAGVDHLFADPELPDRPIVRVVDPDLRDRMSEWIVMHALMHLRQLRRYESQQRARLWLDDDDQPAAAEVSVGILGLGVLGLDAARKLQTLGFRVAGWSATPKSPPGVEAFHGSDGLDALLAKTDILVALLPLTPQTRGILDAALFAKFANEAGSAARSSSTADAADCRSRPTSSPRSIRARLPARRSTFSRASHCRRLPGCGSIRKFSSARTTPRCRRRKPSPPRSCGRSTPMSAACR